MTLTGVHMLLTYRCLLSCEHCFVWSGPDQTGTLTISQIDEILQQARSLGTVEWFYFEGGEPFLYRAALIHGVRKASALGFRVGVVSNAYWATSLSDAVETLRDFKGLVQDLAVSCDEYHGGVEQEAHATHAGAAAAHLGIPFGMIRIAPVDDVNAPRRVGQLPWGESKLMFRGRAAERLAHRASRTPWPQCSKCPHENLRDPARVHVDPLGYVHVCQGISIGNVFRTPLATLCREYDPDRHPIVGPLLAGGPAELARRYAAPRADLYADGCHLCYRTRSVIRSRFPEALAPAQMYGVAQAPKALLTAATSP